jgi:hypothetical protein
MFTLRATGVNCKIDISFKASIQIPDAFLGISISHNCEPPWIVMLHDRSVKPQTGPVLTPAPVKSSTIYNFIYSSSRLPHL